MKVQARVTPRTEARLAVMTHPLQSLTDETIEAQIKGSPREVMARILRNQRDLARMMAKLVDAV